MRADVQDFDVSAKMARLAQGHAPRVLDLFSGCGGLSLGFRREGFEISAAVELDPAAAATHGANFHPGDMRHCSSRDILSLPPEKLAEELELGPVASAFDVLVGGPPCQAFARVGRSKLREIVDHPEAFRHDPRSRLYLEYLRYVRALKPLALLMENVPDVLNHGGQNIAEETCEVLEQCGYVARYTLLNAAFYGVPQMRDRMILIAYRRELASEVSFPLPTHFLELPRGYISSRQVALRGIQKPTLFQSRSRYSQAPDPSPACPPAVTAGEALSDLKAITEHLEGLSRPGVRPMDVVTPYPDGLIPTGYGREMREWPDFAAADGTTAHVTRHLPRDWRIFARMQPGDQYPEAHALARQLFAEALELRSTSGASVAAGTAEYAALEASYVPPYDVSKFPNKWRKMEYDRPARTLMAHLGKDTYSHIHYDSAQARTISVREAARLQSFPDGFMFKGSMNAAFRQIGNAVPPLFAAALAKSIRATLGRSAAPADPKHVEEATMRSRTLLTATALT